MLYAGVDCAADAEEVGSGVRHVHLLPGAGHVGRRAGHLEAVVDVTAVDGVDLVHATRHPRVRGGGVADRAEGHSTALRPRPPWSSWHRKISHSPEQTPPNVGGVPQSQPFFHPSRSNHAKLSSMFETFRMGIRPLAIMGSSRFMIARGPPWKSPISMLR